VKIPLPVISVVASELGSSLSHTQIDSLADYASLEGSLPACNRVDKIRYWLKGANDARGVDPLEALGKFLEEFMDVPEGSSFNGDTGRIEINPPHPGKQRIMATLAQYGLTYLKGRVLESGKRIVAKSLEEVVRNRDLPGLQAEFDRI
jgi:hypothetical protein